MRKKPVEVTIRELEEIIDRYLESDSRINYAIKIVGHPGVGKSALVSQIAKRKNYFFIDTRLAFKENIDLGGYPVPDHENSRMVYYRPRFIPPETVPEGYRGIVWFLDESNRAHPTVIQTLFQIITEHTCGEHALPERTFIILAGNLGESDNTTITEFDDAALDGRLAVFQLKPNSGDWLRWASEEGIHPAIIRYISIYPERLWDEQNIIPNPRGWHQVSQALSLSYGLLTGDELSSYLMSNPGSPLEKTVVSLVGDIAGVDFILQHTAPRELTTREVLEGNMEKLDRLKEGQIPAEDILWAISGAVTYLREKSALLQGAPGKHDMLELGNVLKFIGYSRADTRMSFFYLLIRECGIYTSIPEAISGINDTGIKTELGRRFDELIDIE